MQTEPPKAEPPKRKRRWLQFSLRTMMIFTTVCAVGCAWLAHKLKDAQQQQAAVAVLVKRGGLVIYDYQFDSLNRSNPNAEPPGPACLHSLLGDDFFRNVECLNAYSIKTFDDADLKLLKGLKKLKWLYLIHKGITDAGLDNLTEPGDLATLDLSGTRVTDAGLEKLKRLTHLRFLVLRFTEVTAAGVKDLQKALPNCEINR